MKIRRNANKRPFFEIFLKIPVAWLQLTNNKMRFLVAVMGVAFAGMSVFMQLAFHESLYDSQSAVHNLLDADFVVFNKEMQTLYRPVDFPRRHLYRVLNQPEVASVNYLYASQQSLRSEDVEAGIAITLFGINPANSPFINSLTQDTTAQSSLQSITSQLNATGAVLVSKDSDLKEFGQVGEQLLAGKPAIAELGNKTIFMRQLVDFAGASFVDEGNMLMSIPTFLRVSPGRSAEQIALGLIKLHPDVEQEAAFDSIRVQLPDKLQLMSKQAFIDYEEAYWAKNAPIGFILKMGVCVSFSVGVIIVYQILYNEVSDHLSDYAVLKAAGFKHRYFLVVLMQEALLLAVAGYIPGVIMSLLLYDLTHKVTAIPMTMPIDRALLVLLLSTGMCFTSGVISMRKLEEADPAELF